MLNYSYEEIESKTIKANIAARLHREREKANLSLDALAEKTGYSKPTVQSWEKGWRDGSGKNHIPSMDQLIDLAALYNCTPEYLLCEYDFKTKEITDISLETGLTPESITLLQRMFSSILENPYGGGANNLFLAFLNHFIESSHLIFELIFNRQMLEWQKYQFENDPDKDEIYNAYVSVGAGGINNEIFKDDLFSKVFQSAKYTQPLIEYFEALGYDTDRIRTLLEKFRDYYDILSATKTKQSDFALSDTFLDIVKDFYRKYPDNVSNYDDFANHQRTHISPERIKPIPIVVADDSES